ncbi:helix-turn-helix transcriptional regulator [Microbulbifer agarilyticus]|uniref:LuxR C-terminal-related transcriptional regulator n=1 Tax=Microbulbifer agarilyticus TaxID=260552 RepID=UPI001C939549|nr:LuxR C-terminal-related transcriptional regulator [Microbulbifer agarilyticus]MBY6211659.1 helix-turn-helix transcriptional regulator [Microbulbifer agarilyticus]
MDLPITLPPKESREPHESKESIYRALRKVPNSFARRDVAQQRLELDRFISASFSSGPCYYYVLDFLNLDKPMLVSPEIKTILGLDPENTTIESLIDRGHPEDIPFVAKAEETAFSILKNQIGMARVTEFKISYSGRLRVADGSYRLFNHQAIILDTDERFGVARTLGIHTDISHLAQQGNRKLSLLNLHGGENYRNIDVFNNPDHFLATPSLFTRRELEIVELLAEGKTSAVISELLGISAHTVKNHRKNILKKSGCKTTGHLVSKCLNEGLI